MTEDRHQPKQIGCKRVGVIPGSGFFGEPNATWLDSDNGELLCEAWHNVAPRILGLGPTAHQQQRRSPATDHGMQTKAANVDVAALERLGKTIRQFWDPRYRSCSGSAFDMNGALS